MKLVNKEPECNKSDCTCYHVYPERLEGTLNLHNVWLFWLTIPGCWNGSTGEEQFEDDGAFLKKRLAVEGEEMTSGPDIFYKTNFW